MGTNRSPWSDWMYFVLEITGLAIVVNYVGLTRTDAALSLFGIPFCDWGSIT